MDAVTSTSPTEHFPHPYVAVDAVVLAVVEGALRVVLIERDSEGVAGWGLPGAYVQEQDRLDDTRRGALAEKCGLTDVAAGAFRPLTPRDEPDRDARRRTISLVSWAPVPPDVVASLAPGARLAEVRRRARGLTIALGNRNLELAVDHAGMVHDAVADLAAEVDHLDPAAGAVPELLPERFTMRDVEDVLTAVAAVADRDPPDTNGLRRRLGKLTVGTGEHEQLAEGQRHRPAELRTWR